MDEPPAFNPDLEAFFSEPPPPKPHRLFLIMWGPTVTIEQLERDDWGAPPEGSSGLAERCYQLRKKPLAEFTASDLHHLIQQSIGLEHLIPMALIELGDNPLCEAYAYPGDLFKTVLGVPGEFWAANPDPRQQVAFHVDGFESDVANLREAITQFQSLPDTTGETSRRNTPRQSFKGHS